jgi:nucleolar protein 58
VVVVVVVVIVVCLIIVPQAFATTATAASNTDSPIFLSSTFCYHLSRTSVQLHAFYKFENTTEALAAATALHEHSMSKGLKSFIKKSIIDKKLQDKLAVSESKLGSTISEKFAIKCISDTMVHELMRGIRSQINNLITGLSESDMHAMVLGLSHSLSRYKIKFSPDKVDTMIVQAIGTFFY